LPDIGLQEILLILLIALIVVGPKKLPEIGRTIGKSLREFRRASSEVREHLSLGLDDDDDDDRTAPTQSNAWAAPTTQPLAENNGSSGESRSAAGTEETTGTDAAGSGATP
jgi:sec-independent protein translocase protein TatA